MKRQAIWFVAIPLFFVQLTASQQDSNQQPPDRSRELIQPIGRVEAAKHPLVLEPPIGPRPLKLDPAKLREEADELSKLAQSVPIDIDQVAQGKLPKDTADKLKRIEKLSKHLRGELAP